MNKLKRQHIMALFSYVFYFSKNFYDFEHIIKNHVIFFLILRKLSRNLDIKLKLVEILFFVNSLNSNKTLDTFLYVFQNYILIFITFLVLNIKINVKRFEKKYSRNKLIESKWIIKKEYVKLKFNKINFFILFDRLKVFIQSKKVLYNFFKYHQFNQNSLKNKNFFQNIFLISKEIYVGLFDKFIFFLFGKNKILFKKWLKEKFNFNLFKKSYYLSFLKKHNQLLFYLRFNTSFFLKTTIKNVYLKQVNKELINFINLNMKFQIKNNSLSIVFMKKEISFLGFYFFKNKNCLILKANLDKILIRFFLLNYINKFNKPISRLKQFPFLIKFKLILQSIISYYKNIKNKKEIILKIIFIFKTFLVNIFHKM